MNKIKSDYLNLISGIVVIVLAIIQLIKWGRNEYSCFYYYCHFF
jgi:hypothetical protein